MLTSTMLVILMTIPGLALFYGGMVRKKNVLATLMQSFAITCLVTVLWVVVGYSVAFTPGGPIIGGFDRFFLEGMLFQNEAGKLTVSHLGTTIPESVYVMFQMTFAIITPALIAGALADRMKFSAFMAFMGAWLLLVYCPIAHWVWGGGWLGTMGALDYAGGSVVHLNAGTAGLVAALMLVFPFSKLLHMGGIFLSPTRNLANNNRMKRHVNPWDYPVKVHTYPEWEEEFHDKIVAAGLPLDKE
mgnify:CR=1 FL=1